jgi:uncharacterized protein YacL (UPF0231 family)
MKGQLATRVAISACTEVVAECSVPHRTIGQWRNTDYRHATAMLETWQLSWPSGMSSKGTGSIWETDF